MASVTDSWHRRGADNPCAEHGRNPSTKHGVGKRWQVRYRDANGAQRKENYEKKSQAEARARVVGVELLTGSYVDPKAGKVTLQEYSEGWLATRTSDPSSIAVERRHLTRHILPVLGDRELRELKPSTVQAWLNGLQRTVTSPGYIGSILQTLSSVLNAAVDDELIRKNPSRARSVKPPRKVRPRVVPWTAERVAAVVDALPGQTACMGLLGAGAGLRQGEIFGLAVEDIDFLQGTVRVERQVKEIDRRPLYAPPKGGRTREVPLAPEVGAALSAHLKAYPAHEVSLPWRTLDGKPEAHRLLFTTTQHRQHSRSVFNQGTWKPALAEAGVIPPPVRTKKGVRYVSARDDGMHALRHFYASVLLDAGENVRALADYLGHSDPGLTLRVYAHLMPESADRTRKAVDAALGGVVNEVIYGPSAPDVPRQAR